MMETFDKHHISSVPITQQFNSATSMGRLVLNGLLFFAQFEREIIAERTREKIAATRRKGKWTAAIRGVQRALSNMLTEVFDGPPGQEAYLLNPSDPGLLCQFDTIDASAASKRPMPGKTTIAAYVDHVHFGLPILNRWAAGETNP
jgi:hypothetical protein